MKRFWLMKSEPSCFSIEDLRQSPRQTTGWDGVRNYQARNFMRNDMRIRDGVFFYHSNCTPPGIVGLAEVASEAHPDHTAWDPTSDHPDEKSTPDAPRWFMVDIRFVKQFDRIISLDELKQHPELGSMQLLRKGNRLSVLPVTEMEWDIINNLLREASI